MSRTDRLLAAALFATHGLLDGYLTHIAVTRHGTGVESNPILSELYTRAILTRPDPLGVDTELLVTLGKVGVVLLVTLTAYRFRHLDGWRLWVGSLAVVGAAVVVNNVHALTHL